MSDLQFYIVTCRNTIKVDRNFAINASSVENAIVAAMASHNQWWDDEVIEIDPVEVEEEREGKMISVWKKGEQ